MANATQADQHMQASAWLGKLTDLPGLRGAALQQALLTCIANTGNSPAAGQGWRLISKPVIGFAVALLEKGNVKAAELADALSGTNGPLLWLHTGIAETCVFRNHKSPLEAFKV